MALALLLAASLAAPGAPRQSCQAALGPLYDGVEEEALPGQLDGTAIPGRDGLLALRRERGDALITVKGGDFSGADFSGARLHNICFLDTNLSGSNWSGAAAEGVGFVRANLSGANLRGARMPGILLRQPDLKDADASGADFSGGKLDGGWDGSVENLRLDRAHLTGFRFDCGITIGDGCPLDGEMSLREANLTRADIADYGRVSDWSGARIDGTIVAPEELSALAAAEIAGPIRVRGGEAVIDLSPAEHRRLLPHIRVPEEAQQPSFDCRRASTPVERLICGGESGRLRALDRDVADLYRRAGADASAQQAWLRERDACPIGDGVPDRFCVEASYERRRVALVARAGPPDWHRPGAAALFASPPIELDEGFHADPLYRRLLPVMVGAAGSRVAVRVNRDGSIDARGDAWGANAHSCSLSGDRLRFDRATGWFSGPYEAAGDEPAQWRDQPMPVLLFWSDRAAVYMGGHSNYGSEEGDPRASDYASCGARVVFSEMIRIPVPDDEARALFESIGALQ